MTCPAASRRAARIAHRPTAPSPITATMLPGFTPAHAAAWCPAPMTSDSASTERMQPDPSSRLQLLSGFPLSAFERAWIAWSWVRALPPEPPLGLTAPNDAAILNPMVQYPPVDRTFAALADPTRRVILERLGSGSATISELAQPFGMSLTGMKKHIRLLEDAELVTTEKVGRVRRCMLAPYAFEGISTWLQRLDRFAQVVERPKGDR